MISKYIYKLINNYAILTDMETMSISKQLKERIKEIEPGVIFGLANFTELGNPQAVALELSRLAKKGIITRLTKGKYFSPITSRFGKLGPSEWQVLDEVIKENGGYFAGTMALNRIGVSTQIPAIITIRGARSTRTLKIGYLTIRLYKQGNISANYKNSNLTDIIEAIRLIKRTPDGDSELTITRINDILTNMSKKDIDALTEISKNERPYVRATLGALLENLGKPQTESLKSSLNPITKYNLGLKDIFIPNMDSWGIV